MLFSFLKKPLQLAKAPFVSFEVAKCLTALAPPVKPPDVWRPKGGETHPTLVVLVVVFVFSRKKLEKPLEKPGKKNNMFLEKGEELLFFQVGQIVFFSLMGLRYYVCLFLELVILFVIVCVYFVVETNVFLKIHS